jgi:hypothetical protein
MAQDTQGRDGENTPAEQCLGSHMNAPLFRFALVVPADEQNIALHKTAAQLKEAKNAGAIVAILERCLRTEFDGFRILLDPGHWVTVNSDDVPASLLEKSWSAHGQQDKLVLMMDLGDAATRKGRKSFSLWSTIRARDF